MTCTNRVSRIIMVAAVLAALFAPIAHAATAAPRSTDQTATSAPDGGWRALLGPWDAFETWLRNVIGADSGEGGEGGGESGGGDEEEGGGSVQPPPPPPACPPGQNPGPCTDPGG